MDRYDHMVATVINLQDGRGRKSWRGRERKVEKDKGWRWRQTDRGKNSKVEKIKDLRWRENKGDSPPLLALESLNELFCFYILNVYF